MACRSLTKRFGGVTAVHDCSFEVARGSITGFVGANGAGKSTTMRMSLGLVRPSAGAAFVFGRPYRELAEPRRAVGAVLDGPGAHPGHTARSHLAISAAAAGLPRERVDEVLEQVGLRNVAGRRVGAFSTGMRQRLALADALLGDPELLILDEPTNGLDPPGIIWMRDLLRGLAARGRAVLVSSHQLGELAEVADRVVVIDRGRVVADTTLDDLLRSGTRSVELRCADPEVMAAAARACGVPVDVVGDLLVLEGVTAAEAGELAETAEAGPLYWLAERTRSFEEAYLALAAASETAGTQPEAPGPEGGR